MSGGTPPKLHVILTSVRPQRAGLPVSKWMLERAKQHGGFDVKLVDLAEVNLPVFNEPKHPRLQQYEHPHTRAWSATISEADAFIFVLPEYNFFPPPAFVNCIDYLFLEWANKPVGLVSYGGISGGLRSAQTAKLLLTSVRMMPLTDAVSVQMVSQHIENDTFKSSESQDKSAQTMLDELVKWTRALKSLREV